MADRFLIAPFETGLELDKKPWLIPDEAFSRLKNAYVYRGRVKKRFGSELCSKGAPSTTLQPLWSRLAINLGNTSAAGLISWVANPLPGTKWKLGQQFSVGTVVFTVDTTGAIQLMNRTDGSVEVATFSTTDGHYVINIAALPNTPCYFYPSEPVMGLTQYEAGPINNQIAYAFDTEFAYRYVGGRWEKIGPTAGSRWHGSNKDFFWSCSCEGAAPQDTALFTTNFYAVNKTGAISANDDPIWYWNGAAWATLAPRFKLIGAGAGNYVQTAKIILQFKRRLVLLNTIERDAANANNINYVNRCRFSQNGSPISASAWLESNQLGYTGGGYIDPATEEEIISAEFIKDRLIVYFERSTWELAYTGNEVEPFVWQKINTELGCESPFSTVPFDKVILTIGTNGITACSGANVQRVDEKIPDYVFQFANEAEGVLRVHGIRDYKTEMVYWTYPAGNMDALSPYPNTILAYNYKNGSWSENDDCITCWGNFEQMDDKTWADMTIPWEECQFTWNSYIVAAKERLVIAGNQQGFISIINPLLTSNARVMSVTQAVYNAAPPARLRMKIIDHTLQVGDYIKLFNMNGLIPAGNASNVYRVDTTDDKDTIEIVGLTGCPGVYLGGGSVSRVSRVDILTKQWNPYLQSGRTAFIPRIDFHVSRTAAGNITCDYATNSSNTGLIQGGINSGAAMGTNILSTAPFANIPLEADQERLWHSVFFQGEGEFIQLRIYFSDEQMVDQDAVFADFELHGLILHAIATRLSIGGY